MPFWGVCYYITTFRVTYASEIIVLLQLQLVAKVGEDPGICGRMSDPYADGNGSQNRPIYDPYADGKCQNLAVFGSDIRQHIPDGGPLWAA